MSTKKSSDKSISNANLATHIYGRSGMWRVHTPAFLKEITQLNVNGIGVMRTPIQIFADILSDVAQRAIELNDPQLNSLMCRLTLYENADPYSKEYNREAIESTIEKGLLDRAKQLKKQKT